MRFGGVLLSSDIVFAASMSLRCALVGYIHAERVLINANFVNPTSSSLVLRRDHPPAGQ